MSDQCGKSLFQALYRGFSNPLSDIDCGEKCAPYNDYGVPVCCDIQLLVPAAYQAEWTYLQEECDLWRTWQSSSLEEQERLELDKQPGQVLLECLGYQHCQRPFRTITCRAFPFFPYLTKRGQFAGLTYYRDFREQCWIISNLSIVTQRFKVKFHQTYQELLNIYPETKINFRAFSQYIREKAAGEEEFLVLLDFTGRVLKVDPGTENMVEIAYSDLKSFGPFAVSKELPFPDEVNHQSPGQAHE